MSLDMNTGPTAQSPLRRRRPDRRRRVRRWRFAFLLATLAAVAVLFGACGNRSASGTSATTTTPASAPPSNNPVSSNASAPHTTTPGAGAGANTGAGAVTRSGSGSGSQTDNRSTGAYTVAFATCMRAHGVPKFPDPEGSAQLGPGSGIDPTSPTFQAALNGPCVSLAPAGWVSSGLVSNGGAS
jgi:hypothetical protein